MERSSEERFWMRSESLDFWRALCSPDIRALAVAGYLGVGLAHLIPAENPLTPEGRLFKADSLERSVYRTPDPIVGRGPLPPPLEIKGSHEDTFEGSFFKESREVVLGVSGTTDSMGSWAQYSTANPYTTFVAGTAVFQIQFSPSVSYFYRTPNFEQYDPLWGAFDNPPLSSSGTTTLQRLIRCRNYRWTPESVSTATINLDGLPIPGKEHSFGTQWEQRGEHNAWKGARKKRYPPRA